MRARMSALSTGSSRPESMDRCRVSSWHLTTWLVTTLIGSLFVSLPSARAQEGDFLPEWMEEIGLEDGSYGEWIDDSTPVSAAGLPNASTSSLPSCDRLESCDAPGGCDAAGPCKRHGSCHSATLTGDWGGCRSHLGKSGIVYRGRLTQYFFGVDGGIQGPVGPYFSSFGISGGDQFEYTGNSQHDFLFDLERLFGCPKAGRFVVTLENLWGKYGNVSLETGATAPPIFNAFFPVDPDANGVPRVTNFLYVQPVSEQLILSVGKTRLVGTADRNIFAGGDGSDQFLNQTFVANPLVLQQLVFSTFSAGAVMPQEWGTVAVRIIDTLERSEEFMEFSDLFSDGMVLLGQVRVNTRFFGKPGEHHIGANYKRSNLLDLRFTPIPPSYPYPPAPPGVPGFLTKSDSYAIFYGFDQYLGVYGKPDAQGDVPGWGMFGRLGISDGGGGNPNFKGWHVSAGLGGDSLLKSRRDKQDRFGIAYGYTASSDQWGAIPTRLFGPRDSQAFEAFYRYQVTPAISITPDVQWVRGTLGELTGGQDAFVYGLRLNMLL